MIRRLPILLALTAGCGGPNGAEYAGTYAATFAANYTNTTPTPSSGSYTDSATVTATDEPNGEINLVWQVGTNPPSGTIVFMLDGANGNAVAGSGTGGSCFMGHLTNGNTQTTCCDHCTIVFTAHGFTQDQSGHYSGVTPGGVAYSGTYTGAWTGTRTN
jgi:hypothetical protein